MQKHSRGTRARQSHGTDRHGDPRHDRRYTIESRAKLLSSGRFPAAAAPAAEQQVHAESIHVPVARRQVQQRARQVVRGQAGDLPAAERRQQYHAAAPPQFELGQPRSGHQSAAAAGTAAAAASGRRESTGPRTE